MPNPFIHGNPVSSNGFTNRTRELRRLAGRISTGQSIALVGDPRMGKTSLLEYLASQEMQSELYGSQTSKLVFFYMDGQSLGATFTQAHFWQRALLPLYEGVIVPQGDATPIALAYKTCVENNFGNFVIERLLAHVEQAGYHLILLLDEFDAFLHHSVLNSAEFFGGLRSLASRSGALVLVTASRQPLSKLNKDTQEFNRTGSPYFNFLDELVLEPFSQKASNELLDRAGETFNSLDRGFILRVAGGHPYLLQAAASHLWDALTHEEMQHPEARAYAGEELFSTAARTIEDTWRLWSPETKKAFTAIALDHSANLLGKRAFDVDKLVDELPNYAPEVRTLEKQGYIISDAGYASGYHVRAEAFLWWLSEELIRTVRAEKPFEDWFREQEWDGLVKKGEKAQLHKAAQWLGSALKEGVSTFIKAAAEGAAKGVTGGG